MRLISPRTWHGWLGLVALGLGVWAAAAGVAWVRLWFYQIAWWSYILLADALVQARAGNSLLVNRRASFWVLCLASAGFWFAWEMVNLRLNNWHYFGVPQELWLRWPGAFVAYATVLPGIFETYEALSVYGLRWGARVRPIPATRAWYPWFLGLGVLGLALPLLWPRLFFPLVWGAVVFLLEPLNHRFGAKSLMRSWEQGDLSPLVRLLLAGLICGLFWESWNWLAIARWAYDIPYLSQPRLFAMPLAGYLGFAPFALECYVFFAAVSLLRGGRGWQADDQQPAFRPAPAWLRAGLGLATVAYGLWMCRQIDLHLVKGWLP